MRQTWKSQGYTTTPKNAVHCERVGIAKGQKALVKCMHFGMAFSLICSKMLASQ